MAPLPKKVLDWSSGAADPEVAHLILASSWIGFLGSIPLILRLIGDKPLTMFQTTKQLLLVGILMSCAALGAIFLFVNSLWLQSPKLGMIRPLTVVECIFMISKAVAGTSSTQTGGAHPENNNWVHLYIFEGLFVVFLLGYMLSHMIKVAKAYEAAEVDRLEANHQQGRANRKLLKDDGTEVDLPEGKVRWAQKDDDVLIQFILPYEVTKKDVKVTFNPDSLFVSVGGAKLLNGKIGGDVKPSECTWTLRSEVVNGQYAKELHVFLVKKFASHRWEKLVLA
eukprot:TRINITY_DN6787_c0_g9_i1.p1 TRINITY_DN6787_c0_g9~~TRINITY_DN6787_c0_g9_i1.p1  ORF type:complete len:319 (+),score=47.25 TRINITY_DN6787_c0_g9_i1:116-958(+)